MTATLTRTVVEHGLPFSGSMVRAILDGTKTQTRRVVRLPKRATFENAVASSWDVEAAELRASLAPETAIPLILGACAPGAYLLCNRVDDVGVHRARCPYGQPGDRLWVRERHVILDMRPEVLEYPDAVAPTKPWPASVTYAADDSEREVTGLAPSDWRESYDADHVIARPSIHMPRWASRLTLELTATRVERVQDISEDDARAEGAPRMANVRRWDPIFGVSESVQLRDEGTHRCGFQLRWEILNAQRGYGWDVNPYVWVLEFAKVAA